MYCLNRRLILPLVVFAVGGCAGLADKPIEPETPPEIVEISVDPCAQTNRANQVDVSYSDECIELPVIPEDFDVFSTLSQVIRDLSHGNVIEAEEKLKLVLLVEPENKNAQKFLDQIHADPSAYFGEDYFTYKIQRGDSMSSLAQLLLKDHLKFYIFSRYSGLDDPSSIVLGQEIKIPAKYKRILVDKQNLRKLEVNAGHWYDEGDFQKVIHSIQSSGYLKKSAKLKRLLILSYQKESENLEASESIEQALFMTKKARHYSKRPETYSLRLKRLESRLEAKSLLRLARLHLKSGQLAIALQNVTDSLALYPHSEDAKQLEIQIRQGLDAPNNSALNLNQGKIVFQLAHSR